MVTATARWGALAALVLLGGFIVGIARLLRAGRAPDCHCFGQIHSEPVGASTLIRNAVLATAALVVAIGAPGRSLGSFDSEGLALLLTGMATVALALAVAVLARENRELRKRPQRQRPSGLPAGTRAPGFSLPDVRGGEVTLAEHLDAGRPVVVAFVSPGCGPCKAFLPDLARWQRTLSGTVAVLAVSDGEMEANLALADETGLGSLLVAQRARVSAQYNVRATPSAVLVDATARLPLVPRWAARRSRRSCASPCAVTRPRHPPRRPGMEQGRPCPRPDSAGKYPRADCGRVRVAIPALVD